MVLILEQLWVFKPGAQEPSLQVWVLWLLTTMIDVAGIWVTQLLLVHVSLDRAVSVAN